MKKAYVDLVVMTKGERDLRDLVWFLLGLAVTRGKWFTISGFALLIFTAWWSFRNTRLYDFPVGVFARRRVLPETDVEGRLHPSGIHVERKDPDPYVHRP